MRKNNNGLFFRLNDSDYAKLKRMAERSHLPMSTVLRKLIYANPIIAYPPVDYWNLFRSIDECRNTLDSLYHLNAQCHNCHECKETLMECTAAWRSVFDAFFNPVQKLTPDQLGTCSIDERTDKNGT
jgi:hypothetical protein